MILTVIEVLLCAAVAQAALWSVDELAYLSYKQRYKAALKLMEGGEYEAAWERFCEIIDFCDSRDRMTECEYATAMEAMGAGEYEKAEKIFSGLSKHRYRDSAGLLTETRCRRAVRLYEDGEYVRADRIFRQTPRYRDSCHYDLLCRIGNKAGVPEHIPK